jgi:hypothetical protein
LFVVEQQLLLEEEVLQPSFDHLPAGQERLRAPTIIELHVGAEGTNQ